MAIQYDYGDDEKFEEGKVEGRHTFSLKRIIIGAVAGLLSVAFVLGII